MGKNFELLGRKSQGEILRTYVSVKRVALDSPRTMPTVSFSAGVLRQHRPLCYLARVSGRRHFKCNRDFTPRIRSESLIPQSVGAFSAKLNRTLWPGLQMQMREPIR